MAITPSSDTIREVLVLFNPSSGTGFRVGELQSAFSGSWDSEDGIDLHYQESRSPEDGIAKVRRAVERGVDTVIVVGGDGIIHTVGAELIHTPVRLGVIPTGSGNGFARHFDIPTRIERAAVALLRGQEMPVDVGLLNDRPFFITASLAWDADIVNGFEKSPVRGIAPYVFAGIYKYFTYEPQTYELIVDGEPITLEKPLVLTLANLTQFGGGAKIAPNTRADDGRLALVAVPHMEPPELLPQIRRLFDGTIEKIPEVRTASFEHMIIKRQREDPVQVDGELMQTGKRIEVKVLPRAIRVLVPRAHDRRDE